MAKYIITKVIEARSIQEALKNEAKAEIDTIEKENDYEENNKIGYHG